MLPLSRNRTYVAEVTYVDPTDLNDIQDCIIGGKHGDRTLVIPASAFIKGAGNSSSAPATAGDIWTFSTPPNDSISAPVVLPVGSRIKQISFRINKASSASGMLLQLAKRVADANAPIYSVTEVTSGATWSTHTSTAFVHVMAADVPVWIFVQAGAVAHQFSYATIVYDGGL